MPARKPHAQAHTSEHDAALSRALPLLPLLPLLRSGRSSSTSSSASSSSHACEDIAPAESASTTTHGVDHATVPRTGESALVAATEKFRGRKNRTSHFETKNVSEQYVGSVAHSKCHQTTRSSAGWTRGVGRAKCETRPLTVCQTRAHAHAAGLPDAGRQPAAGAGRGG